MSLKAAGQEWWSAAVSQLSPEGSSNQSSPEADDTFVKNMLFCYGFKNDSDV